MSTPLDRDAERVRALLADLWLALRARVPLMAVLFVLAAVVFAAALYPRQRYFEATALIQVSADSLNEAVASLRPAQIGLQAALTDARAIRSPDTLRRTIERAGLIDRPAFIDPGPGRLAALLVRFGFADPDEGVAARLAAFDAEVAEAAAAQARDPGEIRMLKAIAKIAMGLTVTPAGQSNVLEVTFRSRFPDLAAEIANAVGETFVAQQRERLQDRFALARQWHQERIAVARADILRLEREIQARFHDRTRQGLTAEGVTAVVRLITEEIARAETDILRERNRLDLLDRLSRAAGHEVVQVAARQADLPQVADFAERLGQRLEQSLVAEARLGADAANAVLRRSEFERDLSVLRRMLEDHARAQAELIGARQALVARLRAEMASQLALLSGIAAEASEDAVIEAELRLSRDRLSALSVRVDDFGTAAELVAGQAHLVGAALPPLDPSGRGAGFRMALAVAAALAVAGGGAVGAALADDRYRDPARLAADAGLQPGPLLRKRDRRTALRRLRALLWQGADAVTGAPPGRVALATLGGRAEGAALSRLVAEALDAGHDGAGVAVLRLSDGAGETAPGTDAAGTVTATVPFDAPLPVLRARLAALLSGMAQGNRPVLVVAEGADALAVMAATEADVTLVSAAWGRVHRAALRDRPEIALLSARTGAFALLHAAPGYAVAHGG